jgi:hypothetical protein
MCRNANGPGRVWPAWLLFAVTVCAPFGCGHTPTRVSTPSSPSSVEPWTPDSYRAFIADNQATLDRIYAREYIDYRFEVDTARGPVLIQRLIEPEAMRPLAGRVLPKGGDDRQILDAALAYVTASTRYQARPDVWPTLGETLSSGITDCKGRSLLLLSLLLAADRSAFAAIGNGHMWVVVKVDEKWRTVETDPDPQRNRIYASPGFYDRPLYKIYADRTLKRRRLEKIPN